MEGTGDVVGTRVRLLRAGADLVHRQGYAATGVAQICAEAGARKGSFYHFWPSKRDLVVAGLAGSFEHHRAAVLDPAFAAGTLREGLQRWGVALAGTYGDQALAAGHVLGCRFGNLALELAATDEVLRAAVLERLEAMAAVVAAAVAAGVERGEVPAQDAAEAGRTLVAHMEGLALLAKVTGEPERLRRLGADAWRLVAGR